MGGVINNRNETQHQGEGSELDEAPLDCLQRFLRKWKFYQVNDRDQYSGQAEDSSRGAYAETRRMPHQAGNASCDAAGRIDREEPPSTEDAFRKSAEIPQAPHVARNVPDETVDVG